MENSCNVENLEDLRKLVGEENYNKIVCRFGGERIYIPCSGFVLSRNEKIQEEFDEALACGISSSKAVAHLGRKHNLSESWIRKILRNYPHSAK